MADGRSDSVHQIRTRALGTHLYPPPPVETPCVQAIDLIGSSTDEKSAPGDRILYEHRAQSGRWLSFWLDLSPGDLWGQPFLKSCGLPDDLVVRRHRPTVWRQIELERPE